MKGLTQLWTSIIAWGALLPYMASATGPVHPVMFATFAEDANSLRNVLLMAESIRTFGGKHKNAPIRAYVPEDLAKQKAETVAKLGSLGIDVRFSQVPEDAGWFYFAAKVFAAAKAEVEASGVAG
jgi:hypothetical protein